MKLYGGIDLHSNNSLVALLDKEERLVYRKRLANDDDLRATVSCGDLPPSSHPQHLLQIVDVDPAGLEGSIFDESALELNVGADAVDDRLAQGVIHAR